MRDLERVRLVSDTELLLSVNQSSRSDIGEPQTPRLRLEATLWAAGDVEIGKEPTES